MKNDDLVTLYATSGQTHVHYEGENYMVDSTGAVKVPSAAVAILEGHGFSTEEPEGTEVEATPHAKKKK